MRTDRTLNADTLLAQAQWVRALARSLLTDGNDADDVAQDTYLAALRKPPGNERNLRAWFATLTRHFAFERRRRHERALRRERQSAASEALPSTADLVERADLQRRVVAIVLALEEPYRSTLLLRFFEDLEPALIATRLQVPSATVRSWLKRALARVREQLDRDHDGNRSAWAVALAPVASMPWSPLVTGVALMSPALKVGIASGVLCLMAATAFYWLMHEEPPAPSAVVTSVAAGTEPLPTVITPRAEPLPARSVTPAPRERPQAGADAARTKAAPATAHYLLHGVVDGIVREHPWSSAIRLHGVPSGFTTELTANLDATGAFAFDLATLIAQYQCDEVEVCADDPAYLPASKRVLLTKGDHALSADELPLVRLPVEVARTEGSRVLDEQRQGVEGAIVGVYAWELNRPASEPLSTAVTDKQGFFELRLNLKWRDYVIAAINTDAKRDLRPVAYNLRWSPPDLVLPPGVSIAGIARKAGVEAIDRAVVRVTRSDCVDKLPDVRAKTERMLALGGGASAKGRKQDAQEPVFLTLGEHSLLWRKNSIEIARTVTSTDAEGEFRVGGLVPADYQVTVRELPTLTVHPALFELWARTAAAPADRIELDILYGVLNVLVSNRGIAVPGAIVRLELPPKKASLPIGATGFEMVTGQHGTISLATPPDTRMSVSVSKAKRSATDSIVTPGYEQATEYRIRLP